MTPPLHLSAKEILILVQALRIATEDGSLYEFARKQELEALRHKLNGGK